MNNIRTLLNLVSRLRGNDAIVLESASNPTESMTATYKGLLVVVSQDGSLVLCHNDTIDGCVPALADPIYYRKLKDYYCFNDLSHAVSAAIRASLTKGPRGKVPTQFTLGLVELDNPSETRIIIALKEFRKLEASSIYNQPLILITGLLSEKKLP